MRSSLSRILSVFTKTDYYKYAWSKRLGYLIEIVLSNNFVLFTCRYSHQGHPLWVFWRWVKVPRWTPLDWNVQVLVYLWGNSTGTEIALSRKHCAFFFRSPCWTHSSRTTLTPRFLLHCIPPCLQLNENRTRITYRTRRFVSKFGPFWEIRKFGHCPCNVSHCECQFFGHAASTSALSQIILV